MSHSRGKRIPKSRIVLQKTLALIQSLKELEEKGALHINEQTREVHLIREIFWDGKDEKWIRNFTANLYTMIERHNKVVTGQPYHIYAIDMNKKERGEYLTSYIPSLRECKPLLALN